MYLRKLEIKDAPLMLSWMHDEVITRFMYQDYSKMVLEDAINFISASEWLLDEKHMAIANDDDDYMGTVSLRHIDKSRGLAEFAIVVRAEALGKGYALHGMIEMLDKAFKYYGLERIPFKR